jgi:hypothetical protein
LARLWVENGKANEARMTLRLRKRSMRLWAENGKVNEALGLLAPIVVW